MNLTELLKQPEYNFLTQNPDLKAVIYLTLSGSYGYGTNNEYSDIDLRGVLIEDKKYLLGLESFEQFEYLTTDTVIYGLKKFIKLCAAGNPNALELLGTDNDCIAVLTEQGKLLKNNAHLFLSQRIVNSFGNYATAQLRRLQNALCHDHYAEQEQTRHLEHTLKIQLSHFKSTYTDFNKGAIKIYTDDAGVLKFDITLQDYPVHDFVGIYSELSNTIRTYNKLNHRNRKKDDIHLYKHAMHLIRLLITGTDILNGNGISTNRRTEHDLLMGIRNGAYSFEQIFKLTDCYRAQFEQAAATTTLPSTPDLIKIQNLLIDLYEL